MTVKGVTKDYIKSLLIPLPPLSEQYRIVVKIEELMQQVDEYEKYAEELFKLDALFPENMKTAVLQAAVQGKLVPQDPNDDPSSVLLERIYKDRQKLVKEGKIKKNSAESMIFKRDDNWFEKNEKGEEKCIDDEIPFDIPDNWSFVRLGTLCSKMGSGSTPTGGRNIYKNEGIMFIRSQNVHNMGLILDNVVYISNEINNNKIGTIVKPMDLLLNITGASIGRCAIVPDDFSIGNVNQHVMILRLICPEIRHYLHYSMISQYVFLSIMNKQYGATKEGLTAEKAKRILIPLPPLQEQKRIVSKIEESFAIIDEMDMAQ